MAGAARAAQFCIRALGLGYGGTSRANMVFARIVAEQSKFMLSHRLSERLWRHHLPVGLFTFASAGLLYASRDYADVITRLSFASAYPALLLVGLSLMIGPWKLLKRRRGVAISMDLRRDVGIWAGLASIFHAVIGNFEHLRGRPWLYYIYEKWQDKHVQPFRHDEFGLGNFTGLFAALITGMLQYLGYERRKAINAVDRVGRNYRFWRQADAIPSS